MRIGIDISQLAFENTGVANYLENFVNSLLKADDKNEYVLFYASLRKELPITKYQFLNNNKRIQIKIFKIPPFVLDILWNKLHIAPIEWFVGDVDVFITSDWTEPPAKSAKKGTIIYDMIIYKHPEETHEKIVRTHKKKLSFVKDESDFVITISESSKKDIEEILGIESNKISVIYPAILSS